MCALSKVGYQYHQCVGHFKCCNKSTAPCTIHYQFGLIDNENNSKCVCIQATWQQIIHTGDIPRISRKSGGREDQLDTRIGGREVPNSKAGNRSACGTDLADNPTEAVARTPHLTAAYKAQTPVLNTSGTADILAIHY